MMQITAVLLTYNESPNIARTLSALAWVSDIVVVDSHSTDDTRAIAATFPNVRIVERRFTTHEEQWNFGLQQVDSDWVLALDADFVLSDDVAREIQELDAPPGVNGYRASFTYCIDGTPIRSGVYPPVTVLFRRAGAAYRQDGHTQRIQVSGQVLPLEGRIRHDDRKPLAHWVASQVRYMRLEADKLTSAPASTLGPVDRVRQLIVVAPALMFLLCLFVRGGVWDGRAGLFYALQRTTAELLLSLSLMERYVLGPRAGSR